MLASPCQMKMLELELGIGHGKCRRKGQTAVSEQTKRECADGGTGRGDTKRRFGSARQEDASRTGGDGLGVRREIRQRCAGRCMRRRREQGNREMGREQERRLPMGCAKGRDRMLPEPYEAFSRCVTPRKIDVSETFSIEECTSGVRAYALFATNAEF